MTNLVQVGSETASGMQRTTENKLVSLALHAVGGQGGGVLTNWIVAVAEANGYVAQSTSVAGVAQRTGATIYYVEMCPRAEQLPVFSLAPAEGDIDILMAAELAEAGRAVQRGFVSPNRTTVIASTHRVASVFEKIVPGDGRTDSEKIVEAIGGAAEKLIAYDMERIAKEAGSFISASMLGALAGSGALPFSRDSFEAVIRESGRGVDASLRAFGAAFAKATAGDPVELEAAASPQTRQLSVSKRDQKVWSTLTERVSQLPAEVGHIAAEGLAKVVDYQDMTYGDEYLAHLGTMLDQDEAPYELSAAAAKYIANAMCYDDIIRVADLKTRAARFERIHVDMGTGADQLLLVTEYFHPRLEEFLSTLPEGLAAWLERRKTILGWLDRKLSKGRRVRTDSIGGFTMLWIVSLLRRWRRRLRRHDVEMAHLAKLMELTKSVSGQDRRLAAEVLSTQRLIKGYSDTHARGHSKFDKVTAMVPHLVGRDDAADWMRRMRTAALKDEKGMSLDGVIQTIHSFAEAPKITS
ncbi:indolepyruvate oxidoreductase subunit beta family protein [Shimia sediminis]|uniref:indolepyruvate oxidoreductase subunit beta family protein n=1 Tax=Shimia sediminis TaxID=2497945 RepID=UPI001F2DBEDB|nr:indolepyruvate oxidoreductase subunit beta family protein [Shimia sediminis]